MLLTDTFISWMKPTVNPSTQYDPSGLKLSLNNSQLLPYLPLCRVESRLPVGEH